MPGQVCSWYRNIRPGGWWQGQSVWATTVSPSPATGCDRAGMCAKWLFGPWGTRWTRWPVKAASGETSPGSWDLLSHFPPFLSDLSWEQRWGWRGGRWGNQGQAEAVLRSLPGHLLVLAAPSSPVNVYPLLIKAVEAEPRTSSKLPSSQLKWIPLYLFFASSYVWPAYLFTTVYSSVNYLLL